VFVFDSRQRRTPVSSTLLSLNDTPNERNSKPPSCLDQLTATSFCESLITPLRKRRHGTQDELNSQHTFCVCTPLSAGPPLLNSIARQRLLPWTKAKKGATFGGQRDGLIGKDASVAVLNRLCQRSFALRVTPDRPYEASGPFLRRFLLKSAIRNTAPLFAVPNSSEGWVRLCEKRTIHLRRNGVDWCVAWFLRRLLQGSLPAARSSISSSQSEYWQHCKRAISETLNRKATRTICEP
jgi:hypothetical protein